MPSPFPVDRDLQAHSSPRAHADRAERILDALADTGAAASSDVVEILSLRGDDSYDALTGALAAARPDQLFALELAVGLRVAA